ncbi:MAG: CARDB domain-containing protein [Anaerolineales bacterium]
MKIAIALSLIVLATTACVSTPEADPPTVTVEPAEVDTPLVSDSSEQLPDLVMDYTWVVKYTSSCPWGGPGYVIMRGRNIGAGDAASFQIQVWDQLSRVDSLSQGEQVEVRADFESGPVGSIPATIDSENEIEESDEENNEILIVFTPPPKCTPEG